MSDLRTDLVLLGVKISNISGGSCCRDKQNTTAYFLPMKLDIDILPFLKDFGDPKPDFKTTGLLKIEMSDFAITGVRKICQIRFILRNKNNTEVAEKFETKLIEYIKQYK